jgi:hypothetical protein
VDRVVLVSVARDVVERVVPVVVEREASRDLSSTIDSCHADAESRIADRSPAFSAEQIEEAEHD